MDFALIDMTDMNSNTTPCEIRKPNGDTYPSELFGIFQYSDSEGSKPVAVVKLKDGSIGTVNVSAVKMRPATHFYRKDGTRVNMGS